MKWVVSDFYSSMGRHGTILHLSDSDNFGLIQNLTAQSCPVLQSRNNLDCTDPIFNLVTRYSQWDSWYLVVRFCSESGLQIRPGFTVPPPILGICWTLRWRDAPEGRDDLKWGCSRELFDSSLLFLFKKYDAYTVLCLDMSWCGERKTSIWIRWI